MLGRRN